MCLSIINMYPGLEKNLSSEANNILKKGFQVTSPDILRAHANTSAWVGLLDNRIILPILQYLGAKASNQGEKICKSLRTPLHSHLSHL